MDNYVQKISRIYDVEKKFKNQDTGETIDYNRLVLQVNLKDGELYNMELKVSAEQIAILKMAENLPSSITE